ncbi:chitinase [Pseudoalteromonas sp. A25]|uniref:glycoside hydrolase family 18 protein n=1 Tax=Pseudoalteromonas sp. A25 TaxID=116092 RepID=UPI001260B59E|nr:glycoside hydrolase family 18 protein [Pseudoalteromonas sp. A25]BBN83840.1 chitinase [Pseudoalteromonas sp. A25]
MKNLHFIVFLLFSALSHSFSTGAQSCKPIIAVYPSWIDSESNQASIRWELFDYLAIASIYPLPNGQLHTVSVDAFIQSLAEKAHTQNKKVIISIGGSNQGSKAFLDITKDDQKLKLFIENITSFIKKYNLDGVDIDWEYWTYQNELGKGGNDPIESAKLVKLLERLRSALPDNILLSADIFAGNWVGKQYLPEIQKYVDYINLMAYDFTGAWPSSPIAHHSNYLTFQKAIDFVIAQGFDKNKLIVGLPSYGIQFIDGDNKQIKHIAYADILKQLDTNKTQLISGKYKNIYFETPNLVAKKINYINQKEVAGIMLFELLSDSPEAQFSLLTKIKDNLITSKCP